MDPKHSIIKGLPCIEGHLQSFKKTGIKLSDQLHSQGIYWSCPWMDGQINGWTSFNSSPLTTVGGQKYVCLEGWVGVGSTID